VPAPVVPGQAAAAAADVDGDANMQHEEQELGEGNGWTFPKILAVYKDQKLEGSKIVSSGKVGASSTFTAEQVHDDWTRHCGYKGSVEAVRQLLSAKKCRTA
jgi:hypothetical protein